MLTLFSSLKLSIVGFTSNHYFKEGMEELKSAITALPTSDS